MACSDPFRTRPSSPPPPPPQKGAHRRSRRSRRRRRRRNSSAAPSVFLAAAACLVVSLWAPYAAAASSSDYNYAARSSASSASTPSSRPSSVLRLRPRTPSRRRRRHEEVLANSELERTATRAAAACTSASPHRTTTTTVLAMRGGYAHVDFWGDVDLSDSAANTNATSSTNNTTTFSSLRSYFRARPRLAMYGTCLLIILVWVVTGTLVYSHINGWPLATSFFYAVDAGMSIGFCTDVAERTIKSRAFSVVFILLGASVVGGALAVLVADVLEGASRAVTAEWRMKLERDAFAEADDDGDGTLSYDELGTLLRRSGYRLEDEQVEQVCRGLDRDGTGKITYGEFLGTFKGLGPLIRKAERRAQRRWRHPRALSRTKKALRNLDEAGEYRMFLVFFLWVAMGVAWGMLNQGWDPITATHFAISALATGGLTAPPVNDKGVLPDGVAMFVGLYSLLGIPLFYLAMGHFAKILVQRDLADAERRVIETPLRPYEYNFAARTLCSKYDDVIHLSDFVVLHFLRRGLTDVSTIELIKGQFRRLDKDGDGVLSFEEATNAAAAAATKAELLEREEKNARGSEES